MIKKKWFLNGGRGSGRTIRLLCETYENKIAVLQHKLDTLQGFLDHDIEYDMDKTIQELRKENEELKKELEEADNATDCFNRQEEIIAKAKEIIREVIEWANWQGNSKCPSFKSIQNKAEQFISEEEK